MVLPTELQDKIKERIKKAEEMIPDLEKELVRMRLAKIDTKEQSKELAKLKEQVTALKLQYGK